MFDVETEIMELEEEINFLSNAYVLAETASKSDKIKKKLEEAEEELELLRQKSEILGI